MRDHIDSAAFHFVDCGSGLDCYKMHDEGGDVHQLTVNDMHCQSVI